MATEKVTKSPIKSKRSLDLRLRQATVTNLNFSPEKSGKELGQIRIHQECVLSFKGYGVEKGRNKAQGKLDV